MLKFGGESLILVLVLLYEAAMRCYMVPKEWNVVILQLIWKNKSNKESINIYRPIALTSVFRKVLGWILLREVKISLKGLDIAQGGSSGGKGVFTTWHLSWIQ